jgi:hypothetical protein
MVAGSQQENPTTAAEQTPLTITDNVTGSQREKPTTLTGSQREKPTTLTGSKQENPTNPRIQRQV